MRSAQRRIGLVLAIIALIVCSSATAAGALSLHPTDWQSSIISIAPSTDVVSIDVLNGGEAIQLTTQPGHSALILGYRNEPYLQISTDGEVQANLKSPTWWANKSGTGSGSLPDSADPLAEPEWSTIGTNGSVAWHDHRIHAMPGVTAGADWTVLISVDDKPLVIRGQLTKLPSHGPLIELLVAIVAAATIVVLGFRRPWFASTLSVVVGAIVSLTISIGAWTATPPGFTHPWVQTLAAALALLLAGGCLAIRQASRRVRVATMVGAVAALGWWTALNVSVLTAVFIPNSLTAGLVRFGVGLVVGLLVGTAVVIVVSGGFTETEPRDQAVVDSGNGVAST